MASEAQEIPSQPSGPTETNPASAPPTEINNAVPSDKLPTPETIKKCSEYTVLDKNGEKHTFKSLYDGPDATARVMIIFIRHFFCGSCQEFLLALSKAIKPSDLLSLQTPTSIAIIGCGDPGLIDFYATQTNCSFPIYADPDRKLYNEFELVSNLALGDKPEYFKSSMPGVLWKSFKQSMSNIATGLIHKGGTVNQNGGEFLFEGEGEEKAVTWCHRMTNTRDHSGIPETKRVLDPEGLVLGKD